LSELPSRKEDEEDEEDEEEEAAQGSRWHPRDGEDGLQHGQDGAIWVPRRSNMLSKTSNMTENGFQMVNDGSKTEDGLSRALAIGRR